MPEPVSSSRFVLLWMRERFPVMDEVGSYLARKSVPQHKYSLWYYFGGLTLFFFSIQVVTGILLALYYRPSPEHAHESIQLLINDVPYGWLIRSLHSWGANLMIATLFIHMFSAFLMRAYRKPRELMWLSGSLLLFLMLGFGFTGYLLPWDTIAYFATLIGTEVPKTLPVIGDWGVSLLKGGEEIGGETLTRMYTIHIVILPLISIVIVSFHVLMNQLLGSSVPIGVSSQKAPIPFFPNFLYRDLVAWSLGFLALLTLAILLPWGLGEKADPFASAPLGIKPEWYFLPLYQTLKIVPSTVFTLSGEFIVNALVGLVATLWVAIPFLDRKASRGVKNRVFSSLGLLLIAYLAITIVVAYAT